MNNENYIEVKNPARCTLYSRKSGGYLFELSPQLGCVVGCDFCDCGEFRANLTAEEVVGEIKILQHEALDRGISINGPCQIAFTDGGELLLNPRWLEIIEAVTAYFPADIKISTVLPAEECVRRKLRKIFSFMKNYPFQTKLQVSLYSTDPKIRQNASKIPLMSFEEISLWGEEFVRLNPSGRKVTLAFTLTDHSFCWPDDISSILTPENFAIALYPYKKNTKNGDIKPMEEESIRDIADAFRKKYYTVITESDRT